RHDPAIDAIAALRGFLGDPGGLQRMRLLDRAETGQRGDGRVLDAGDRRDTRAHRFAIDMDRAGAALAEAATEMRIGQPELVAQRVEQRHLRVVDRHLMGLAVDLESELLRHFAGSSPGLGWVSGKASRAAGWFLSRPAGGPRQQSARGDIW